MFLFHHNILADDIENMSTCIIGREKRYNCFVTQFLFTQFQITQFILEQAGS